MRSEIRHVIQFKTDVSDLRNQDRFAQGENMIIAYEEYTCSNLKVNLKGKILL